MVLTGGCFFSLPIFNCVRYYCLAVCFRRYSNDQTGKSHKHQSHSRQSKDSEADSGVGVSSTEKRFAYSLLEKLLEYVDKAALNLNNQKPSTRYSRRHSYSTATEDVKFFAKVQ